MIPLYKPHIPAEAALEIGKVLNSGQIAGDGNPVDFEGRLREFLRVPHVAVTAEFSRTVEMALRMAGLGPGDEVLLSPMACLATTMPILQTGARPVWCDLDPATGSLDPAEISRRRTPAAKAVLLYHWVGIPGDVSGVRAAAAREGLKVIEDAGESLGAERDGLRIGAHGCDYSVLSFSPVRHITTGEGAALIAADAGQDALARLWRRYGIPAAKFRDSLGEISAECDIQVPGFHNYLNRIGGTLGVLQMEALPGIVAAHRANGEFYTRGLGGVPGIELLGTGANSVPSYWVFCFLCERSGDLLRKLRGAGIYASRVHLRNDVYSCFGAGRADLPGVAEFEARQLCIPCGWWVTAADREHIVKTIQEGW